MEYKDFEKNIFEGINDFDLVHIFECGQCFRWTKAAVEGAESKEYEKCEECENEASSYIGVAGSYAARISYSEGKLVIEASGGDRSFWADYFDLGTDYGAIKRRLTDCDAKIKAATEYGCGIRILNQDLFETLISFIISQNNNIPRIRKCIEAICEKYGSLIGEIGGKPVYAFPTPEALAAAEPEDLAALKLGYRSSYIVQSSREYIECKEPSCREELICMHGIGPKVANCIMLFGLRDVAAFPIDTWVRHIMSDMYGFDEKDVSGMESFAREKFGDYAGYAQQYLFYYYRDRGSKK
ncbi:MAG: 8-oxoguanine DNA glycosylase [Mogibacterium sp.]|nr:8-oxoguanine DNA glycosylase [Mogibacterium sp.]